MEYCGILIDHWKRTALWNCSILMMLMVNLVLRMMFNPYPQPSGKKVFWHSSAHILGEAMERHYGGCLCYGPPIDSGYYYDMFLSERLVIPQVFRHLATVRAQTSVKQRLSTS